MKTIQNHVQQHSGADRKWDTEISIHKVELELINVDFQTISHPVLLISGNNKKSDNKQNKIVKGKDEGYLKLQLRPIIQQSDSLSV